MDFEWDLGQSKFERQETRRVTFTEAMPIFGDPLELLIPDPDHSEEEFRFLSIGRSETGRLLLAAYTEREGRIRLISA